MTLILYEAGIEMPMKPQCHYHEISIVICLIPSVCTIKIEDLIRIPSEAKQQYSRGGVLGVSSQSRWFIKPRSIEADYKKCIV